MKKFVLIGLAAFLLPLFGEDLSGTWQGTLQAGRELRTVVKISKAVDGSLKGIFYSIDQGGQPISLSSISLQGSTVKMAIAAIGGSYEGKLSADGKSIAGNWSQGPNPLALNLVRATDQTAWAIPAPPPKLEPMAADANPTFEVATLKPSDPNRQGFGIMVRGRQISTINTSFASLVQFAYGIHARQIVGGPDWLESEKYDLIGKPDGTGQPNDKQWKLMVQKVLAERFQFKFHRDKKELSVYAIVVGKNGVKMTKSEGDPNGLPGLGFRGRGALFARNANIQDFAGLMQSLVLDRPVLDQTGLQGRFDFSLDWTPDEFQFGGAGANAPPPPPGNDKPDLFTAIQQQMGLKLESTKAPAEVFVVDHVEKPSAN